MAFTLIAPVLLGAQPLEETSTTQRHPLGTTATWADPTYGEVEAVYAKGVASTAQYDWVTLNPDDWTTARLLSGAAGKVGISMSANVASQYGWYVTSGKIPGKALALYADNGLVYATATAGSVDDAAVSGDLVAGAKGASAVGTPSAGLAEFELDEPSIDATTGYGAGITALTDNSGGAAADGTIGVITAPTAITDNSGGAAADGTIGVVTAPTAITDNSGGAVADGTIAVVTLPTALVDNGAGAADGTIEAETNIDLLVDGTTGAADNTVSPVPASYSNSMMAYQLGRNGAGALALANVEVGDDVLLVANITDAADDTALYEATISVQNQIQQTGAGDHSAKMNIFVIRRSFEGVLNNNYKELTDQAITQRSTNTSLFNNTKDLTARQAENLTAITALRNAIPELTARQAEDRTAIIALKDAIPEITARQAENRTALVALKDAVAELATKINAIIAA